MGRLVNDGGVPSDLLFKVGFNFLSDQYLSRYIRCQQSKSGHFPSYFKSISPDIEVVSLLLEVGLNFNTYLS